MGQSTQTPQGIHDIPDYDPFARGPHLGMKLGTSSVPFPMDDMLKLIGETLGAAEGDGEEPIAAMANMRSSAELCPGDHSYALTCGLGLAHMDAHVRGEERAASLLERDLCKLMSERGVTVELL